MLDYFDLISNKNIGIVKSEIKNKLQSIYNIESLAKYFEDQKKNNIANIELRCNLTDLIFDLDFLKQYLSKNT